MQTKYKACADFKSVRAEHSTKTCKILVVSLKLQFYTARHMAELRGRRKKLQKPLAT